MQMARLPPVAADLVAVFAVATTAIATDESSLSICVAARSSGSTAQRLQRPLVAIMT